MSTLPGTHVAMSNAITCEHCGEKVIWLALAHGGKKELFDGTDFPYDDLSPGNRWAFSRQRGGVIDVEDHKHPPRRCLRKHYCKGSYENRRYRLWTVDKAVGATWKDRSEF